MHNGRPSVHSPPQSSIGAILVHHQRTVPLLRGSGLDPQLLGVAESLGTIRNCVDPIDVGTHWQNRLFPSQSSIEGTPPTDGAGSC